MSDILHILLLTCYFYFAKLITSLHLLSVRDKYLLNDSKHWRWYRNSSLEERKEKEREEGRERENKRSGREISRIIEKKSKKRNKQASHSNARIP